MSKNLLIILLPFLSTLALGNGLIISNLSVNESYTQATFDIAWENSWRQTERFHDAVWIYLKYRPDNGNQWEHAHISGGTAGGNLELVPQTDEKGIFIRNATDFSGNVSPTSITVDIMVDENIAIYPDFEIYGIEMVYVPEGPFFVGDGNETSLGADSVIFDGSLYDTEGKDPYITRIDNAGEINFDYPDTRVPATYPNGFDAFYCMKYPFTQKQFVDFLNQLSYDDQALIVQVDYAGDNPDQQYPFGKDFRQGIYRRIDSTNVLGGNIYACNLNDDGVYNNSDDGEHLAASFRVDPRMSDAGAIDVYAIEAFLRMLNWTGLRPMSELEYEKAARGPLSPIAGEFAWGAPKYLDLIPGNIANAGTESESYVEDAEFYNYLSFNMAHRVGMFAESGTDRLDAQASYWGVQDLSGNGYPLLISIYNDSFIGSNGTGSIKSYPLSWTLDIIFYEGTQLYFNSRIEVSEVLAPYASTNNILGLGTNINFQYIPGNGINLGILKGRGVR